jgi:hypothetical protein
VPSYFTGRPLLPVQAIEAAAVAALVVPTLALGQAPAPKLTESQTSGFPDKAYLVTLPLELATEGDRNSLARCLAMLGSPDGDGGKSVREDIRAQQAR